MRDGRRRASTDTGETQEVQRGREGVATQAQWRVGAVAVWLRDAMVLRRRGAKKGRDETAEGTRDGNGCAAWSQDRKSLATSRRLWAVATRRRDTAGGPTQPQVLWHGREEKTRGAGRSGGRQGESV
jgi:hypothetical protein